MVLEFDARSGLGPRLYRDLAEWYPLLTPVGDYAEEAAFYRSLFQAHCRRRPCTLLDLGSGGGHNAAHLKTAMECTLVDLEPSMLSPTLQNWSTCYAMPTGRCRQSMIST